MRLVVFLFQEAVSVWLFCFRELERRASEDGGSTPPTPKMETLFLGDRGSSQGLPPPEAPSNQTPVPLFHSLPNPNSLPRQKRISPPTSFVNLPLDCPGDCFLPGLDGRERQTPPAALFHRPPAAHHQARPARPTLLRPEPCATLGRPQEIFRKLIHPCPTCFWKEPVS